MFLYNLTVQRATAISHAIQGNFSGSHSQEIVLSKGRSLELLSVDSRTGKVYTLLTYEVFGIIRCMVSLRLEGLSLDSIVITTDSGKVIILSYSPQKNIFEKLQDVTITENLAERFLVTGQHLAVDPTGRSLMIGAVERQKSAMTISLDPQGLVTVSSPSKVNNSNALLYHMVALDVGIRNPIFACLQIDYEETKTDCSDQIIEKNPQMIVFYELDPVVGQVARKQSEFLEGYANLLIAVPGGDSGPSGVLIYAENYITYMNLGNQRTVYCPIPRRGNDLDDPERGIIFVCSATYSTGSTFFFLAQTEQGDIFKITLENDMDMVTDIKLKYFDTVPVASAMCILKTGLLFVASEFGNHYLYQIANLGDDDDEIVFSSTMELQEDETFFFNPRPLRNMVLVNEMESLSPIMSCHVANIANDDSPQIYALCGRGPRSSLRVLRHGLEVSLMGVSELPGNPIAVWTIKSMKDDEYDKYIIVSFVNGTLVLSIGETVEEATDSGFLRSTSTLLCAALNDDALIQVYPDGVRYIAGDKMNEWKAGKQRIVKCVVNQRQIVIALSDYDLVFLEIDMNGHFHEYKDRRPMNTDIVCMDLTNVDECSWLLAVGLADGTIHIIQFDTSLLLTVRATHPLQVSAQSVCMVELTDNDTRKLYLSIGLIDGTLIRTVLDPATGSFSETRTAYLGPKGVKLFKIRMHQGEGVLALSDKSWLSYYYQSRFHLTPLSYESLEYASSFSSEQCPEGIVAISANTLRILTLEKLGVLFSHITFPMEYTPRKFTVHPKHNTFYVLGTDHNAYVEETKKQRRFDIIEGLRAIETDHELAKEMAESFLNDELPETIFTAPKAGRDMWASTLRIIHPVQGATFNLIRYEQNEAALALTLLQFQDCPGDLWFLIVGIAKDFQLNPSSCKVGFLHTYQVDATGKELELVHKTELEEVPTALCGFGGRLLVGADKVLRLYDIGEKNLITISESEDIPNAIVDIQVIDNRIFVSDVAESLFMVCYSQAENQLTIFADDTHPRWITCTTILDYDTIACADKFGNVVISRVPFSVNYHLEQYTTDEDESLEKKLWKPTSQKMDTIATFHIGEIVTTLKKTTLKTGGTECLLYSTLSGTLGLLVPFTLKEYEFFQQMEKLMCTENPPLSGRDHTAFRSCYFPVKNVIDGDLCEQYYSLGPQQQTRIAANLNLTPAEVSKKIEDVRTQCAFS